MDKLVKINFSMGKIEYDMYQDIPKNEDGSENLINGESFSRFDNYLNKCINEETIPDSNLYDATTNRYIYYIDDYPIGEVGIRTTLNQFWTERGSQIFYKVRLSERRKGYGSKMLKLALEECKKMNMEQVRINCNDLNSGSKKIILKNGGVLDISNYETEEGTSSSYIIKLIEHEK